MIQSQSAERRVAVNAAGWDLSCSEPVSREELSSLIRKYKDEGCIESRNRVVETHLRLVARVARQQAASDSNFDDLMTEGALALIRALENFDPSRGVTFTSYACTVIEHAVQAAGVPGGLVKVPTRERRRAAARRRLEAEFFARHGRMPSAQDLAQTDEGRSVCGSDVVLLRSAPLGVSLDAPLGEGGVREVVFEASPSAAAEAFDEAQLIRRALERLDPVSAEVVRLRFGLAGGGELSTPEIASKLALSRRNVEVLLGRAFRTLRERVRDEELSGAA